MDSHQQRTKRRCVRVTAGDERSAHALAHCRGAAMRGCRCECGHSLRRPCARDRDPNGPRRPVRSSGRLGGGASEPGAAGTRPQNAMQRWVAAAMPVLEIAAISASAR